MLREKIQRESKHAAWELDPTRFLTEAEMRLLLRSCERLKDKALSQGNRVAVKDWMLICIASETGLRVKEIADLSCGDIRDLGSGGIVVVRNGKGGKRRNVFVSESFIRKAKQFFAWKQSRGESVDGDSPVFTVRGRRMSKRALQKSYNRSVERAGITQPRGVGIHSLRHTYASFLLRASKFNLRLVQKQLGHSSLATTETYLHLFNSDIQRAVARLYA